VRRARAPRACPLLPSLLATALWAALPVHAADLTGPLQVNDGDTLQLGADDVLTHSAGSFALTVTGTGSNALIDGSRIHVTGNGSACLPMAVQLRDARCRSHRRPARASMRCMPMVPAA
jgi:autotransporter family porin